MNNVYFSKNDKLQSRNRAGMIRSYRTTRTLPERLMLLLDMILYALDRTLDVLVRPAVRRAIRGVVAIACIGAFFCLIGAVESQSVSLLFAAMIAVILVVIEILCLRGN